MNNRKHSILVVDDERDIVEFLSYNLIREGFAVHTAYNGVAGLKKAREVCPDLVLLDMMMPGIDGVEVCNQIRNSEEINHVLIAMLSARSESYSQIAAFEAGADDYIVKPIRPKVLISRLRAMLRRPYPMNADAYDEDTLVRDFGNLRIDIEKHKIIVNSRDLTIPRKEFVLLTLLTSKPSKVFSREEIYDHVWGGDVHVSDRTIDVYIRKLREKIGQERIHTIKSVGYRFDA